jgi:hypothetical protein
MVKKIIIWASALTITIILAIFQYRTSPGYPATYLVVIGDEVYESSLIRSNSSSKECLLEIKIDDKDVNGHAYYRKYKSNEAYKSLKFTRYHDELVAVIPSQYPTGKVEYYVELVKDTKKYSLAKKEPVVVHFKRDVPFYVLIPYSIFIFMAVFFSVLCGLYVILKIESYQRYIKVAFYCLLIGGFILGPLVQKIQYNVFWAGLPFGYDLKSTKFLIVFLFLWWAYWANRKKARPVSVMTVFIVTLVMGLIPNNLELKLDKISSKPAIILLDNFNL